MNNDNSSIQADRKINSENNLSVINKSGISIESIGEVW